jgi:hypothetical protein
LRCNAWVSNTLFDSLASLAFFDDLVGELTTRDNDSRAAVIHVKMSGFSGNERSDELGDDCGAFGQRNEGIQGHKTRVMSVGIWGGYVEISVIFRHIEGLLRKERKGTLNVEVYVEELRCSSAVT